MTPTKKIIRKIISGGQSGVDRSALDFAIQHNIPHAGWCPKNRWAEDGKIHPKYNLQQTKESEPIFRTQKNISTTDGTLIIYDYEMDEGTLATLNYCKEINKPYFIFDLNDRIEPNLFKSWIKTNNIKILNISGSRESNSPGIYKKSFEIYLGLLFN